MNTKKPLLIRCARKLFLTTAAAVLKLATALKPLSYGVIRQTGAQCRTTSLKRVVMLMYQKILVVAGTTWASISLKRTPQIGFLYLLAVMLSALAAPRGAYSAPFAYISVTDGKVAVLDTATNTIATTITLPRVGNVGRVDASTVTVTPNGKRAYVFVGIQPLVEPVVDIGYFVIIDTDTNTVVGDPLLVRTGASTARSDMDRHGNYAGR
jgi:hypothetical protein